MPTQAQFHLVYLGGENVDESRKLMQVFMKDAFANTAKSCKWQSSTNNRSHVQFDVQKANGKAYELDFFSLDGSESSLIGADFQNDDGTHRFLKPELLQGVVIAGSVEDAKDKAYKPLRDEVKKWVATYKTERGLGPKDNPFFVVVQNNVEGFDSTKLAKKIKDDKIYDTDKVVFAATPAEMLENLVKVL